MNLVWNIPASCTDVFNSRSNDYLVLNKRFRVLTVAWWIVTPSFFDLKITWLGRCQLASPNVKTRRILQWKRKRAVCSTKYQFQNVDYAGGLRFICCNERLNERAGGGGGDFFSSMQMSQPICKWDLTFQSNNQSQIPGIMQMITKPLFRLQSIYPTWKWVADPTRSNEYLIKVRLN